MKKSYNPRTPIPRKYRLTPKLSTLRAFTPRIHLPMKYRPDCSLKRGNSNLNANHTAKLFESNWKAVIELPVNISTFVQKWEWISCGAATLCNVELRIVRGLRMHTKRIIEKDGLMFGQVSNIVGVLHNAASGGGALIRESGEVVYGPLVAHVTMWTQYTKYANCCHKERAWG
ncbi:hypothetical protein K0M31_007435 [Melipona bicolor]|uniref:Uncharacterized protein n=1 Tax=Melipona bicolor TaxID=60889 RepID=A0AA40KVP1_9HYME|nr:hypothetical protein K0M31_007435 [Melipona bicolor]